MITFDNTPVDRQLTLRAAHSFFRVKQGFITTPIRVSFDTKSSRSEWFGHCRFDNKEIKISINQNTSNSDMLETFFHELTHASQLEDGRLYFVNGKRFFNGKEEVGNEHDFESEVEARNTASRLYGKFLLGAK